MTAFDYTQLDPGIRCVVRLLHRWGYEASDSGDGRTKQASGLYDERDLMTVPHVVIIAHAGWGLSVSQSGSLQYRLEHAGVFVTPQGQPGATIQYTYCPASHDSTIMLMDLSDDDLPDALRAELEAEIAGREGSDE